MSNLDYWGPQLTYHLRPHQLVQRISNLYPDFNPSNVKQLIDAGASIGLTTAIFAKIFSSAECLALDLAENLNYPLEKTAITHEQYRNLQLEFCDEYLMSYPYDCVRNRLFFLNADFYTLSLEEIADLIIVDNNISIVIGKSQANDEVIDEFVDIIQNLSSHLNVNGILAINNSATFNYCFYIRRLTHNSFQIRVHEGCDHYTNVLASLINIKLNSKLYEG